MAKNGIRTRHLLAARLLGAAVGTLSVAVVAPVLAQDAPAAAPAAPSAIAPEVTKAASDFWHYAKIARYDLANTNAATLLNAGPDQLLLALENISRQRNDDLDQWLLRWGNVPELKENLGKVNDAVREGRFNRRSSPAYIAEQIKRLSVSTIGFQAASANLRASGELAVPQLLQVLNDPNRRSEYDAVRRAIIGLGKTALNPLVAATEATDPNVRNSVVSLLGELGYPDVSPYLQAILAGDAPETLKAEAKGALARLSAVDQAPSAGFYQLAEKFYYNRSSIASDNRYPTAFVWSWEEGDGLTKKDVPQALYGPIMAMRSAEYTLQLSQQSGLSDDALALWIAANYKRQTSLVDGATDATRAENTPDAQYYGTTSGARYLTQALNRSLSDSDVVVAFNVVKSLQEIVGRSNLTAETAQSLISATQSPDRRVRFEAAFALGMSNPLSGYSGADTVVPLIGEALAQTGSPTIIMVLPELDAVNAYAEAYKAEGVSVLGATTASQLAQVQSQTSSVDIVVVDSRLPGDEVDLVLNAIRANPKLNSAARVVLTESTVSRFEDLKRNDAKLVTSTAKDAASLKSDLDTARANTKLPIDANLATDYAQRAANLLRSIGMMQSPVYKLDAAKPALLRSLTDQRNEVATVGSQAAAFLDDAGVQQAILAAALDTTRPPETRIAFFKSLATSARLFGNHLTADNLATLETVVAEEPQLPIRGSAAEARGSLNLPADQAKSLVLKQVSR